MDRPCSLSFVFLSSLFSRTPICAPQGSSHGSCLAMLHRQTLGPLRPTAIAGSYASSPCQRVIESSNCVRPAVVPAGRSSFTKLEMPITSCCHTLSSCCHTLSSCCHCRLVVIQHCRFIGRVVAPDYKSRAKTSASCPSCAESSAPSMEAWSRSAVTWTQLRMSGRASGSASQHLTISRS